MPDRRGELLAHVIDRVAISYSSSRRTSNEGIVHTLMQNWAEQIRNAPDPESIGEKEWFSQIDDLRKVLKEAKQRYKNW